MGWREVYCDESRDDVFERQQRLLQQIVAMQTGHVTWQRQNWASIWKRQRYL
jgi:hypothetical protein